MVGWIRLRRVHEVCTRLGCKKYRYDMVMVGFAAVLSSRVLHEREREIAATPWKSGNTLM